MNYLELFERVAKHVKAQGCDVSFKRGSRVPTAAIDKARKKSAVPLPDSLLAFYQEVGNGLAFAWQSDDDDGPFASIAFPKLSEVVVESLDDLKWRVEWSDSYGYQATGNPKLAKQTALRMRKWLAFHEDGEGNRFCLNTGAAGNPVVFDQHDWMDGGSGKNGHVLGKSLIAFYRSWSKVCFQFPSSLWWPSVFRSRGGVDWASEEFREPYRLPGSA
jgi:hypothetical protein